MRPKLHFPPVTDRDRRLLLAGAFLIAACMVLIAVTGVARTDADGGYSIPNPLPWLAGLLAVSATSGLLLLAWLRGQHQPPSGESSGTASRYSMKVLLLMLVASAALPLAFLLAHHMQREATLEVEKARQLVTGLADVTAADTTAALSESERIARYLAERPMVRALDPAQCDPYLYELKNLNRNYANLATVDAKGNSICSTLQASTGVRPNIGNPAWLQNLKANNNFSVGGPQKGIYSGRWIVVLAYPIRDDGGAVIGAAQVALDLDAFQPVVRAALPAGGVVGLMDGKGVVIARSGQSTVEAGRDISGTGIGRTILARQQNSEILVGNDGVERYYAYRKIDRSDWYAVVGVPTDLVYAEARRNVRLNLLVGAVVTLFSGILVFFVHRRIVTPLATLRDTARAIGSGDNSRRAPETGPAEIAEVATTFNRLMDLIPQIEGRLQASEDHYRLLFESSPDAIRVVCDNRIVLLNEAAVALYGVATKEAMLGRNVVETMHPDYRERVRERMRAVLEEGRVLPRDEQILLRDDGSQCWIETIVLPFTYEGKPALLSIARDLSERKNAEKRVKHLIDLRLTVGRVHEAIARERDWQSLCESTSRIVVEGGVLVSALIRMHDQAADTLVPFAGYGPRTGRLGNEIISAADPELPPAVAFSSRRHMIINQMNGAGIEATARADALAQGVGSAGLFPMVWEDRAIGTLAVFAAEPDVFDEEFTTLLDEIATSLAFAHAKYKAEVALAESNARLTGMIASAMDAIITVDEAMHVAVFNRAAEAMFGIASADAIGMPLEDFMPARYRSSHAGWMRAFATAGATTRSMGNRGQVMAQRSNGEVFPAEASISHAQVGRDTAYTVIMRDVTGRLTTERALADAERRYRSLVENSPGGVALLNGEFIEYTNPGLVRMLGFEKSGDIIGNSIFPLLAPALQGRIRGNLIHLAQAAGRTVPNGRVRMIRRDGSAIDVEAAATSIDIGGRTLIQVEMRDVTREVNALAAIRGLNRTLEARIEARTGELTHANRELESFAYSIAHDLRGPLRSMTGFAQLLAMEAREGHLDQVYLHVDRIVNNAHRMNDLIDGLLRIARASHMVLERQRIDTSAMVAAVIADLKGESRARINVGPLPAVVGDPVTLRQVWTNLISNALKYSSKKPSPEITISRRVEGVEVIFSVADNGAGFNPAYADKLFGVFQRLHASAEFEGNGIGLAIVRRIVERHDGRVWAEGKPDAGATFNFSIPIDRISPA